MTPIRQIPLSKPSGVVKEEYRPALPAAEARDQRARGRDFSPWWESWKVSAIDSPRFSRWVEGIEKRRLEADRETGLHQA